MKTKTSFEHIAHEWDVKVGEGAANMASVKLTVQAILTMLKGIKQKRIYEIACGNGFLARQFVKAGAREVYASDISPELIHIAQTKYESKRITYSIREGTNITELPRDYFDAVVIHQGIFYIENLDKLFKNIRTILKPGGVVIYTVLHPLFPAFRNAIGDQTNTDASTQYEAYPTNYLKKVEKKWQINGETKTVHYWTYKRPLATYINVAGKHGLFIEEVAEPESATIIKGELKTSPIPSSLVIKAVKI